MKTRIALLFALAAVTGCREPAADEPALIAAAASLRHALPDAAEAWKAKTGRDVTFTFGASGDQVRQVEAGAPVDAVILAAAAPVDTLIGETLVSQASRRVLATNELVLVGRAGGPPLTFATLAALPADEKIAIGDPGAVPAGAYAKKALESLGTWDAVQPRVVFAGDVASTIAYARRGEVAAAIVYRTEITAIHDVVLLDTAKAPWAPRAEVVAGLVTAGERTAEAVGFLDFLAGPEGQALLKSKGFGAP